MAIDWTAAEASYNKFKKFYADGIYKVKCINVEVKEVGNNGAVIMKFSFEGTDEGRYPTVDHWLSFKNANWRAWHNRCLMVMFGLSDEQAKKTVEMCEKTEDKATIVKAYGQIYKKLLAKKPEVEIEVYTNGKHVRGEFTDRSVAMPKNTEEKPVAKSDSIELDEIPEGEINFDDVPF